VTRTACLALVIRSLPVNSGALDSVSRGDLCQTSDTESYLYGNRCERPAGDQLSRAHFGAVPRYLTGLP